MSKKLLHIRRVDENHPGLIELVVSEGEKVYVGTVERKHGRDWDDFTMVDVYHHNPETSLGLSEWSTKQLVFSMLTFWGKKFEKSFSVRLNCHSVAERILEEIDLSQMTEYASCKEVPTALVPLMKLTERADICERLEICYNAEQGTCYSKVNLYGRKTFGSDKFPAVNYIDGEDYCK